MQPPPQWLTVLLLLTCSFDKTRTLCLLLHSADVSHPSKGWEVHHQWTSRCIEEFFVQGDREAEMGLEFSPLCDRNNTMVPQSQIGKSHSYSASHLGRRAVLSK